MRREHDPQAGHDDVELAITERERLGIGLPPLQLKALLRGPALPGGQQFGGQVTGDYVCAGAHGWDRGVAGSSSHIQNPDSRPHPGGGNEDLPQPGDDVGGQGRVVTQRPHCAVLFFQHPVSLYGGSRCGHDGSPQSRCPCGRCHLGARATSDY